MIQNKERLALKRHLKIWKMNKIMKIGGIPSSLSTIALLSFVRSRIF